MNSILEKIVAARRRQIEKDRAILSDAELRASAEQAVATRDFPFEKAIRGPKIAIIAEIKKASPSKGLLSPKFPYFELARRYEAAGADAVSILTEPKFFLGANRYLAEISRAVSLPILRKDFIVAPRMIDEAKTLGASAILLITAILTPPELAEYIKRAEELGLSALVEIHDQREGQIALDAGARMIGVNHRNLTTFEIDLTLSERLRPQIPSDVLFVAESGIKTTDDFRRMKAIGANAVLIGETLVRSTNVGETLRLLRLGEESQ